MSDPEADTPAVLYVDADGSERRRVVAALEGSVADVDAVGEVAEVLDRLEASREHAVDCVVSAKTLDDGTGLELLRAVRGRDPDVPFVLYPREGSERLASEATAAGVSRYLPRSMDDDARSALIEAVREEVAAGRRRRERRRHLEMFDSLLEDAPISLSFRDREARNVLVSEAALSGSWEDPIGKTSLELAREEIREEARRSYEDDLRVIETGEPIVEKIERYYADVQDYDTFWQRTSKVPWRDDDGAVKGVVEVTRDITDLKERERELEHQKRRLDRFASFVSHDLRNPLTVAKGYLELVGEVENEDALAEVDGALDEMDELIGDFLRAARSDVGAPSIEQVSLANAVETAWDRARTGSASLRSTVPEEAVVRADRPQLRRLLENLFKNAIEHAGRDVEVVVGTTETGFFVADDGPGIREEEYESVLEYGYTTSDHGTGVGLAIVTQVVEAHEWSLSIDESDRGGARFDVAGCQVIERPIPSVPDEEGTRVDIDADRDVAGATPPGSYRYDEDAGEWVVSGGGRNLWYDTDECYVAYATVEGDARVVARVADIDPVYDYSKAGITVRAGPESGSPLGFVGMTGGEETEVIWRPEATDHITSMQLEVPSTDSTWFRLDRIGGTVTAYHSADGETWTAIDERSIDSDEAASVGLLVCSLNLNERCTGRFDEVAVYDL